MLSIGARKVVAIGTSTGGVTALERVLGGLPADIPPILVVIHMPPGFTKLMAQRFDEMYKFSVKEAQTGDIIKQGQVLVAPAGLHMKVVSNQGRPTIECFNGPKMHYVIPAADILYESVAELFGNKAVGVIMTGMGSDGAEGLLKMRKAGAATIGQDRKTCTIYGMSKVAKDRGAVQHEIPLSEIANKIMTLS